MAEVARSLLSSDRWLSKVAEPIVRSDGSIKGLQGFVASVNGTGCMFLHRGALVWCLFMIIKVWGQRNASQDSNDSKPTLFQSFPNLLWATVALSHQKTLPHSGAHGVGLLHVRFLFESHERPCFSKAASSDRVDGSAGLQHLCAKIRQERSCSCDRGVETSFGSHAVVSFDGE
jgi:hypothetical protein